MKKALLTIGCFAAATFAIAQTPQFEWAKKMGGTGEDAGTCITTDASGNIYTIGFFEGTADFDPDPKATLNLTSNGLHDVFITKSDASGNLIWAKSFGGPNYDRACLPLIDANGNVYTAGGFEGSIDFDPDPSKTNTLTSTGKSDIYILKLNSSGTFVWAKSIGGSGNDAASSLTIDASGNICVAGSFENTFDFNPSSATSYLASNGQKDIFISKWNSSGDLTWAKSIGGVGYEEGSIISDKSGGVYLSGTFFGTVDFDPGSKNAFDLTSTGIQDVFISKLDASGNFVWARQLEVDRGGAFGVDASGNPYLFGLFTGIADFDPGTGIENLNSANGPYYILKLNVSGNFVWAKGIKIINEYFNTALTTDPAGNIYVAGWFSGLADFDPDPAKAFNINADSSIFIYKLDPSGNFAWAKNIKGSERLMGFNLTVDATGIIYTTGHFEKTVDFDPNPAKTFNLNSLGSIDVFVHKMSQSTTGIKNNYLENKIAIYPNPANGIINLESGTGNQAEVKIQVLNSLGQIVIEENSELQHSQVSIQHLPAGLYFVKVISDDRVIAAQKIIKE